MYDLRATIAILPSLVGCQPFPKSEQGRLLIEQIDDFINKKFHVSAKDVIEAFEAAAARELNINNKPIEPDTFGQYLSVAVFGKILSAYRDYQKQEPRAYIQHYKSDIDTPHTPLTDLEAWELVLKWYKQDNKFAWIAPYRKAYFHLLELGKVIKVKRNKHATHMDSPERRAVEVYLKSNG